MIRWENLQALSLTHFHHNRASTHKASLRPCGLRRPSIIFITNPPPNEETKCTGQAKVGSQRQASVARLQNLIKPLRSAVCPVGSGYLAPVPDHLTPKFQGWGAWLREDVILYLPYKCLYAHFELMINEWSCRFIHHEFVNDPHICSDSDERDELFTCTFCCRYPSPTSTQLKGSHSHDFEIVLFRPLVARHYCWWLCGTLEVTVDPTIQCSRAWWYTTETSLDGKSHVLVGHSPADTHRP